jgi:hypothetical protein
MSTLTPKVSICDAQKGSPLKPQGAVQNYEKMADILRGQMGKIGVYNLVYNSISLDFWNIFNISVNKIWKHISF